MYSRTSRPGAPGPNNTNNNRWGTRRMNGPSSAGATARSNKLSPILVLLILVFGALCFYAGLFVGMRQKQGCPRCDCPVCSVSSSGSSRTSGQQTRFPHSMSDMFVGAGRVQRDDFHKHFDTGVPLDKTTKLNQDVLILYSNLNSIPNNDAHYMGEVPMYSAEDAVKNCDQMKILFSEPRQKNQCMAIMGQWESYHIQKFMRLPYDDFSWGKKVLLDRKLPMRLVSRTHSPKGKMQRIPDKNTIDHFNNENLIPYLKALPGALQRLRPLAKEAGKSDKTVIILVCNHGQSELLVNFACSARARGLDISRVIVFVTDEKTKELAQGVGLHTFYDETIFGTMPDAAAKRYADKAFSGMMMAKVYCVHMISQLGYDFLFQDVDVVWYRNPLPYFHNTTSDRYHFDMYFQDDGAHSIRYAPYSANSGFYYVRYNERTEFYFSQLLKQSDMIRQTGSHQTALTMVLNEHVSLRGLTVKILSRDEPEFPGGYHFHRNKPYMKSLIEQRGEDGGANPYIFHMSWTYNKENKLKFFQQLGDWYVQDMCIGSTAEQILKKSPATDVGSACCSAEPLVQCFYRDKPSKVPCKNSPPIDKGKPSWW